MCVKCVQQIVAKIVLLASMTFVIEEARAIRITRASGVTSERNRVHRLTVDLADLVQQLGVLVLV